MVFVLLLSPPRTQVLKPQGDSPLADPRLVGLDQKKGDGRPLMVLGKKKVSRPRAGRPWSPSLEVIDYQSSWGKRMVITGSP